MRKIERPAVEEADPNAISVKHGGRVSCRPCEINGKPSNKEVSITMNQSDRNSLSSDGAGYVLKEGAMTPRGLHSTERVFIYKGNPK